MLHALLPDVSLHSLSANVIEDEGATVLASALKINRNLTTLK